MSGSAHARHSTRATEPDLWTWIRLVRSPGTSRWGFLLRAETMHGFGPWGMRRASYEELELVTHWKSYLDQPMRYLRHVLNE